jgi:uncharacterized protein
MSHRLLFACCLFLTLGRLGHAQGLALEDVQNPRTSHAGWVTDPAGVLGPVAASIEARLTALKNDTGAEVAVVILPTIDSAVPRQFATDLFKHWGIGRKEQDDGVLVLHVLDQRRVEIETGYGVEGLLPDQKCAWLISDVAIPYFRHSDFARGHAALSVGLDAALRDANAGHDALVKLAQASASPLPFGHFGNSEAILPPSPRRLYERQRSEAQPWLWSGLFLALPMLVLRLRAHRAFHREKAQSYKYPWLAWALGIGVSTVLVIVGLAKASPEWLWGAQGTLFATCLGVAGQALWWQVRARRRYRPRRCEQCAQPMRLLSEQDDDAHLVDGAQTEERIASVDYDVWLCACGYAELQDYKGPKPALLCQRCAFRTDVCIRDQTVTAATEYATGLRELEYVCRHCQHGRVVHKVIPRESRSSSSSSGSSSSSSFGGGRSGGGGAGGSY